MLILFILIIISSNCTLDIIAPKKDSEVKLHLEIIGSTHSCANIHQLFTNNNKLLKKITYKENFLTFGIKATLFYWQ